MKSDVLRKSPWEKFFQGFMNTLVTAALRPKVEWEDPSVKDSGGVIFVCNHTSHLDGAFAGAVFRRFKPYVLTTKRWCDKKFVGRMLRWSRSIPIDLNTMDTAWYTAGREVLENGGSMVIFPEGGISRDGKMNEFKPGAGVLAAKTGAVIVPAAICGRYDLFFGKRQYMLVGKPIEVHPPENVRASAYAKDVMKQAEREVLRLYGVLEERYGVTGVYGTQTEQIPQTPQTLTEPEKVHI